MRTEHVRALIPEKVAAGFLAKRKPTRLRQRHLAASVLAMGIVGCAAGAALISNHYDWLWIFGAIVAAERTLAVFIDNSNRNWFMHTIDNAESDQSQRLRGQLRVSSALIASIELRTFRRELAVAPGVKCWP